jgi:hypothetical protein
MRPSGTSHWNYKHGGKRLTIPTPEYTSYVGAKARCTNPASPDYKNYGGRGIEFRFESFEQFRNTLGLKPSKDHSIDRIDVNGHYEPGNVRWASRAEQQLNKRTRREFTLNGKTLHLYEWLKLIPLGKSVLLYRRKLGWCDTCILTKPKRPGVKQTCLCSSDGKGKE